MDYLPAVSPRHVKCVECHVGEGIDVLISSKLNGSYQILSLTFHLYKSPIPTPVHQLRPVRETCEKCHWPEKFYGTRLKTVMHYAMDEASTPKYTTLNLKIDIGKGKEKAGIHWRISKDTKVRYALIDDQKGKVISHECTTCHSILAMDENEPFKYLKPAQKKERNATMHRYLQDEFLNLYNRD